MSLCLRSILAAASSKNIYSVAGTHVQKRFRYYWRERPQSKYRVLLQQVTLPKLPEAADRRQKPAPYEHGELHGMDSFVLQKEVVEIFNKSDMVVVCLFTKPTIDDEYFQLRYELQQKGMNMTRMPSHVMKAVLNGTKYDSLADLCETQTTLVYGETNLHDMFEIIKGAKFLSPMGGLYHERLYKLDELKHISELGDVKQLQGELIGVLSSQIASTSQLLQKPLYSFFSSMSEHQKTLEEQSAAAATTTAEAVVEAAAESTETAAA